MTLPPDPEVPAVEPLADVEVVCPRCGSTVEQRFYGPCASCRAELRRFKAPAPDPRFRAGKRMDGSHCVDYVGPIIPLAKSAYGGDR